LRPGISICRKSTRNKVIRKGRHQKKGAPEKGGTRKRGHQKKGAPEKGGTRKRGHQKKEVSKEEGIRKREDNNLNNLPHRYSRKDA
jgi:hypothetical protein